MYRNILLRFGLCVALGLALLPVPAAAQSTEPLTAAEWTRLAATFGLNGKKRRFGVQATQPDGFVVIVPSTADKPHDFAMAPLPQKVVKTLIRGATKLYANANPDHDYSDAANNALWRGLPTDAVRQLKFAPHLLKAAFTTLQEGKAKPGTFVDYFNFYYANKAYSLTVATKTAWDHFLGRRALSPAKQYDPPTLLGLFGKAAKKMEEFTPPTMAIASNDPAFYPVFLLYAPMRDIGLDTAREDNHTLEVARTVLSIVADIALPAGGGALVGAALPEAGLGLAFAKRVLKIPANATVTAADVAAAKRLSDEAMAAMDAMDISDPGYDRAYQVWDEAFAAFKVKKTLSETGGKDLLAATGIRDAKNAAKAVKEAKKAVKAAGKVADKLDEAKAALKAAKTAAKTANKTVGQARAAAAIVISLAAAVAEEHLGGHIKLDAYDNTLKDAVDAGPQPIDLRTLMPRYEEDDGLYYAECAEGFEGKGPVCWQTCPEGSKDNGATCWKTRDIYGRGFGYLPADRARCQRESGTDCEDCLALVYPNCRAGYLKTTCNLCQSKLVACPDGMIDRGDWCEKGSYGRGAGLSAAEAKVLTKLNRTNVLNTLVHMMIADPGREGALRFRPETDPGPLVTSKMPGSLQHIEAGSPFHIWGRQPSNAVYRWNGNGWDRMPGAVKQLSVGADGEVWAIGASGEVLRWDGLQWARMPGTLEQVAVGDAQNIWGLHANESVHKWNGSAWDALPARLDQIAAGAKGAVWGVYKDRAVQRKGNRWVTSNQRLKQIAVGSPRNVWGLDAQNKVWQWTGSSWQARKAKEIAYIAAGFAGGVWSVSPKQTVHAATTNEAGTWDQFNNMHAIASAADARLGDRVNGASALFFTVNAGPDACSKHYRKSRFQTSGIVKAEFMAPTKQSFRATLCRGTRIPLDQITYVLPGDVAPPAGSVKMGHIKPAALANSQWQGLSVMRLAPGNRTLPPQAKHYLTHNSVDCAAGSTKSGWIKNTAFDFKPLGKGYTVFPAFGATICTLP